MRYSLFGFAERLATEDGTAFVTAGLTKWIFTLNLARLSAGASVEVVIEASPRDDDTDWVELFTFGVLAAAGQVVKKFDTDPVPFTLTERDLWIRASIKSLSGGSQPRCVLQVAGDVAFLNADADGDRFAKELREWADGFARTIERAESDVLERYTDRDGNLTLLLARDGALEAVRAEVVKQAEWAFRRHMLGLRTDATSIATLREMDVFAPGLGASLVPYVAPADDLIWEGR